MKILRSLFEWGSLYGLIGIFLVLFFWEERLNIQPANHTILAIGILVGFGYLCVRWVDSHEKNFLDQELVSHRAEKQLAENRQNRANRER